MHAWISLLLITTLALSGIAHAEDGIQSLPELQRLVAAEVRAGLGAKVNGDIKIQVGRIDPRLRLPACPKHQIEVFTSNARVMGVRCNAETAWTLYVPVNVRIEALAVVAKQNLARGTILKESMLTEAKVDINRVQTGYVQSKDQLLNQVLKQPVTQGQTIGLQQIQSADMVKRGDTVQIKAKSGGLVVVMSGEALGNGGLNEIIHVRNMSSKKVVDGKVVGNQTVEVTL